jgi:prepilin-type N-terminal cleavage/methylation domain-containing protein/prepilin-type processing-associated H-X9-DG protein
MFIPDRMVPFDSSVRFPAGGGARAACSPHNPTASPRANRFRLGYAGPMHLIWRHERSRPGGFTLLELLVAIAILALLAVLLAPVFARVRERSRQTMCSNNQRQLAVTLALWAQDHGELLPGVEIDWSTLAVDRQLLICPTAGRRIVNGYRYNSAVAGRTLGDCAEPAQELLLCDGRPVVPRAAPAAQMLSGLEEIARRHAGQAIGVFLDGHAQVGELLTPTLVGDVAYYDGDNEQAFSLDSTAPRAGDGMRPALTLASLTAGSMGTLRQTAVGKRGYLLFNHRVGADESNLHLPITSVTISGAWTATPANRLRWVVDGVAGSGGGAACAPRLAGQAQLAIQVADCALHTLTLAMTHPAGAQAGERLTLASALHPDNRLTYAFTGADATWSRLAQFTFRGDLVLEVIHTGTPGQGGLAGVFLD